MTEERIKRTIRLPSDVDNKLTRIANKLRKSKNQAILELINLFHKMVFKPEDWKDFGFFEVSVNLPAEAVITTTCAEVNYGLKTNETIAKFYDVLTKKLNRNAITNMTTDNEILNIVIKNMVNKILNEETEEEEEEKEVFDMLSMQENEPPTVIKLVVHEIAKKKFLELQEDYKIDMHDAMETRILEFYDDVKRAENYSEKYTL